MAKTFEECWEIVKPFTMTSEARGRALWDAVNYLVDGKVQGSFVECGVWKGGSAMLIALALLARDVTDRDIFLFDTFEGMTEPGPFDVDLRDNHATDLMNGLKGDRVAELVTARAPLDGVRDALLSTGYPPQRVHFIKGDVRSTPATTQTLRIALLRLDTDFEDSVYASLRQLYPRVSMDGVLIIDDYGHWRGAKRAVDTYFSEETERSARPMMWSIDYTGRGLVKNRKDGSAEIPRYDYIPRGWADPELLPLFSNVVIKNPWEVKWPYLRARVPHIYRGDARDKMPYFTGYCSYEEALFLYQMASGLAGRRGLEIGSHFGWTGAHLLAGGLEMDFVDPAFAESQRVKDVKEVFDRVSEGRRAELWGRRSPEAIPEVRAAGGGEPFAFVFIDGDHSGDAPRLDAEAVLPNCADDAVVMFHDMTSPFVAKGLEVFSDAGWDCQLLNTMQIMGIARRGNIVLPHHECDQNVPAPSMPHLARYPVT